MHYFCLFFPILSSSAPTSRRAPHPYESDPVRGFFLFKGKVPANVARSALRLWACVTPLETSDSGDLNNVEGNQG